MQLMTAIGLRQVFLRQRGIDAGHPEQSQRESRMHPFDNREAYRQRNLIERMFCRLKDFRRIATRYDKLARNFVASVNLAAFVTGGSIESGP